MTDHFSGLTEAEQERLVILVEECSEVSQAACKVLRHGYESVNPKVALSETNREGLQRELGDLLHALCRLTAAGDLDKQVIESRGVQKAERILPYLHHQGGA